MKKANQRVRIIVVRMVFVIAVLCVWEYVAKSGMLGDKSELIFPALETISAAFVRNFSKGYAGISLWVYIGNSMKLLLEGLLIGVVLAFLLSGLSMLSKAFYDVYNLLVSVCDLLSGVIVFLVIHAMFGRCHEVFWMDSWQYPI